MNASGYAASKASASAASALGSIKDLTITDLAITDLDAWSVAEIDASETQSYHMQRWFSDVPSSERVIQDYACALHSGNGHDVSALLATMCRRYWPRCVGIIPKRPCIHLSQLHEFLLRRAWPVETLRGALKLHSLD